MTDQNQNANQNQQPVTRDDGLGAAGGGLRDAIIQKSTNAQQANQATQAQASQPTGQPSTPAASVQGNPAASTQQGQPTQSASGAANSQAGAAPAAGAGGQASTQQAQPGSDQRTDAADAGKDNKDGQNAEGGEGESLTEEELSKIIDDATKSDADAQRLADLAKSPSQHVRDTMRKLQADRAAQHTPAQTRQTQQTDGKKPPEGQTQPQAEYVKITLLPARRTVTEKVYANDDYQVGYINDRNLQSTFGIDPNNVPKEMANGVRALISAYNAMAANANYFYMEGKKAFTARDEAKTELGKRQWQDTVQEGGYIFDKLVGDLYPQARELMVDPRTSRKVPLQQVLSKMAESYPNAFRTAQTPKPQQDTTQSAAGSTQAQGQQQQAQQPKPTAAPGLPATPVGNTAPDSQTKPKPKTMAEGREGLFNALVEGTRKSS